MATDAVPSTTPAPTAATTHWHPAWGIAWAGGMLFVLTLWLRAKFDELSLLLIGPVALLGAAGLAIAAIQLYRLRRSTTDTAAGSQDGAGLVCLAGGVAMIIIAFILAFVLGLAGFGEYVSLGLFGLVAVAYGLALRNTAPRDDAEVWSKVRARLDLIRYGFWVLGPACLIAFVVLGPYFKIGFAWFPELFALLAAGGVFFTAAFWLQLQTASGEIPPLRLRVFILLVGGLTGLIVTLMILMRMFVWRDQVFVGGVEVWLGEGSWRLWFCMYVLLAGLALMFGSLLLAQGEVHENPTLRRSLYGYTAVLHGVLLCAILVLANILFYILVPYTFNWTRTSFSTLSPATKGLLASLKQPVTFYVLMSEGHPATADLKTMLENARIENNRITIENISPDREPRKYIELAERYKEIQPERGLFGVNFKRGVLLVYGTEPAERDQPLPPHAFVPEEKIFERKSDDPHGMPPQMRGRGKTTSIFKAEPEIMKELHYLSAGRQKRKLYVLQGNGELDINNEDAPARSYNEPLSNLGMAKLVARLKKDEYEVQGLKFTEPRKTEQNTIQAPEVDKRREIPEAYAVLVPGPSEPMSRETLDALERYLDKGGRLLAFLDVAYDSKYTAMRTSGMEDLLKKYGVEVRPAVAVTFLGAGRDPRLAISEVPAKPGTLLASQFAKQQLPFYSARVLKALPSTGRYKADVLFHLDYKKLDFWEEPAPLVFSNVIAYLKQNMSSRQQIEAKALHEPLAVAVTVTEGTGDLAKPRMVVFGDVDFITNEERQLGEFYDLVTGSLEWMSERGGGYIGPRPREQATYKVPFTVDNTRLFLYPTLLMMLMIVGLGAGLWFVRRR